MLPPFGEIVRNSSMTKRSSGGKAAPSGLSKSPVIVFVNHALVCGSPPSRPSLRHDVVEAVAPLAERHEVVEALEDDVLVIEVLTVLAVLEPVPGERLSGSGVLPDVDVGSRSSIHDFRNVEVLARPIM